VAHAAPEYPKPDDERGSPRTDPGAAEASSPEGVSSIGVLIVDPSPTLRPVLVNIIGAEEDMEVAGQAATAADAFAVLSETEPHVAVVDISLEDAHGLDLVQNLQAQYPDVEVVIFSMYDERVYAERAVRAGAAGYVMKSEPTERLMSAIRAVQRGEIYLSRRVSSRVLAQLARSRSTGQPQKGEGREKMQPRFRIDELTKREREVLKIVGEGKTTAEIAGDLGLKRRMVNVHQRRIRKKLALGTLTELRQFAVQWTMAGHHVES
jgi:DNA-binding NarL/FixJ family response regulator